MSTCCGEFVRYVRVGNKDVIVDAVPHPAGIYAVHAIRGLFYGHKIASDQPVRPGYTRHRLHLHRKGD